MDKTWFAWGNVYDVSDVRAVHFDNSKVSILVKECELFWVAGDSAWLPWLRITDTNGNREDINLMHVSRISYEPEVRDD